MIISIINNYMQNVIVTGEGELYQILNQTIELDSYSSTEHQHPSNKQTVHPQTVHPHNDNDNDNDNVSIELTSSDEE